MKKVFLAVTVFIALIFQACTPTTSLWKTTDEYRSVSPEKSRLLLKYDLPTEGIPVVKIKVSKDYLSQKIYTKHYETVRNDKRAGQVALGVGITAASAGLIYLGAKAPAKDSSTKKLAIAGGIIGGIYGIVQILKPTPKESWTKDSVDIKDTLYAFREDVKSKSITLRSEHNMKNNYLKTNSDGIVTADVRDFYNNLTEDSPLKILISDGVAQTAEIYIQSSYVSRIRNNEIEAEKLYRKADSKLKESKFIEANSLFEEAISKYPLARFAENSKTAIKNIVSNIKEEKLEIARKKIRAVSENKVPEAFDRVGITPDESNVIGPMTERISRSSVSLVIVDGLGMSLDRYQAENEFNLLTNSQKIYAILAACENISKEQNKPKWEVLNAILEIDESIAKKFAGIESVRLLGN
ncbi:MAG: hypothetical protein FD122_3334 [Stygiobacter sp.]|nr:MAG: hypothetical protein FD122_3334 [Stygiobacter sp.]KAF0214785.1 MAG: hypothetical protein FD178_2158 [Ignavibacteria bacterium]